MVCERHKPSEGSDAEDGEETLFVVLDVYAALKRAVKGRGRLHGDDDNWLGAGEFFGATGGHEIVPEHRLNVIADAGDKGAEHHAVKYTGGALQDAYSHQPKYVERVGIRKAEAGQENPLHPGRNRRSPRSSLAATVGFGRWRGHRAHSAGTGTGTASTGPGRPRRR